MGYLSFPKHIEKYNTNTHIFRFSYYFLFMKNSIMLNGGE